MFHSLFPLRFRALAVGFLAALSFVPGTASAAPPTDPPPTARVVGLAVDGVDFVVAIAWGAAPPESARVMVETPAATPIGETWTTPRRDEVTRVTLPGALLAVPNSGPRYRVVVDHPDHGALSEPAAAVASLRCDGNRCRLEFEFGLELGNALFMAAPLARALSLVPAGSGDALAAVEAAQPQLASAVKSLRWQLGALGQAGMGCQCSWVVEGDLPPKACSSGVAAEVFATKISNQPLLTAGQSRTFELKLVPHCWLRAVAGTESVELGGHEEQRIVLSWPRMTIEPCGGSCSSLVTGHLTLDARLLAQATGGGTPSAHALWDAQVEIGDAPVQVVSNAVSVAGFQDQRGSLHGFSDESPTGHLRLLVDVLGEAGVAGGVADLVSRAEVHSSYTATGWADCIPAPASVAHSALGRLLNPALYLDLTKPLDPSQISILVDDCQGPRRP